MKKIIERLLKPRHTVLVVNEDRQYVTKHFVNSRSNKLCIRLSEYDLLIDLKTEKVKWKIHD